MKDEKIKINIVKDEKIKKVVRERYGTIAKSSSSCCTPVNSCCTPVSSCCGSSEPDRVKEISKNIGYNDEELKTVPEGANLGLGCGNPVALASLKEGETVLDLGSGAGFDCFLAANKVGKTGKVIGVDMTPEMISKARENAKQGNYDNIEFRLGEIENLPVSDNSIDIIISNCVINLVPSKERAFQEAWRVLKPGGRLMISDIVLLKELPEFIMNSMEAYIGCVAGALLKDDYIKAMRNAGFKDIKILDQTGFPIDVLTINTRVMETIKNLGIPMEELKEMANSVVSIKVEGIKDAFPIYENRESNKLKVDIYVPLEACACEWDQFMNRIFTVLTPYIKYINHYTKNLNSEEARRLNLHENCVIIEGKKKITSSYMFEKELPGLLRKKGLL